MDTTRINAFLKEMQNDSFLLANLDDPDIRLELDHIKLLEINIQTPRDLFEFFKGSDVINGVMARTNDCLYGSHDNFINRYSLRVLRGTNGVSAEFKDIALMIHSIIHYDDSENHATVDAILDLILTDCLYESAEVDFFIQMYQERMVHKFVGYYIPEMSHGLYTISENLLEAFSKHRKGESTLAANTALHEIIKNHTSINDRIDIDRFNNQIVSRYYVDDITTRETFELNLSQIMPEFSSVIYVI